MSEASDIFEDLQLLNTQCNIRLPEMDAMPDAAQQRILDALDKYKRELALPEGNFNRTREELQRQVEAERHTMQVRARR
ncbi:MAG: hypothetical protein KBA40_00905 [Candidatus Peribacteraceae bacterium]|nr:hypothetical protein [Candidatus Peribacteraceae bacterium]MBP9850359.1 hypothetical protein [Candidatus Peribacteraceae bacterium]